MQGVVGEVEIQKREAPVDAGALVARIKRERALVAGQRVLMPLQPRQQCAAAVPCFRALGCSGKRSINARQGVVVAAERDERGPAGQGLDVVRLERQRGVEAGQRVFVAMQRGEGGCAIDQRLVVAWIERDGPVEASIASSWRDRFCSAQPRLYQASGARGLMRSASPIRRSENSPFCE